MTEIKCSTSQWREHQGLCICGVRGYKIKDRMDEYFNLQSLLQLLVQVYSLVDFLPCVLPLLGMAVIMPVEAEPHVELIDPRNSVS